MQQSQEVRPEILEIIGGRYLFHFKTPPPVNTTVLSLTDAEARRIQRTMKLLAVDLSPHKAAEVVRPKPSTPADAQGYRHQYWEG